MKRGLVEAATSEQPSGSNLLERQKSEREREERERERDKAPNPTS